MSYLLTCSESPKQTAYDSWSSVFACLASQIYTATERISLRTGISERDLNKQLLLHLPRIPWSELADSQRIAQEAERLAEMLRKDRSGFESWAHQPKIQRLTKPDAIVRACEPEVARQVHERFHYIRSYHPGTVHLALNLRPHLEVPVALASISPMDIKHLDWLFASAAEKESVLVLTRLFAFDWAPRNSISYLLGQVGKWTKRNFPRVKALLTYVNPNLGFTGSSFLAAGWRPFLEKRTVYSYLRGSYITQRAAASLPPSALTHVAHSMYELEPLRILRHDVIRETVPSTARPC